ncbi:DUF3108 domain-containing protein [Zhongshania sp.]|jgi:hypothetical protein|uniref:DUF3108 domain-containing protein n=1 Tax=Zhongshania sp. TaxID=1971902 RepID=UPI001B7677B1|nr:DUF3108 domain-containing protein [Zhongshania sp.]MBQ0797328.1 DUF3108 domain-containing protein [Zhongshania sp.]
MIKTFPKAASFFKRTSLSSLLFGVLINQSIASGGIALYPANTSPTDAAPQIQSLQAVTQSNTATAPQTKEILPYNAEYKISSNSLTTTATRTLSKQGNNWLLSQHAKLMFIKIDEESLIENTKDGLRPLHYEYSNNMSSKQDQSINFDWAKNTASDKKYRKPWSSKVSTDTFDQLGAQLKMREALIENRLGKKMTQTVVSRGKHKTYTIEKIGEETIDSPAGKLRTIKLLRSRPGSSSETTIWMAKDWNYLIVRLEQREDDEVYSLELINATLDGNAVKGLAQ